MNIACKTGDNGNAMLPKKKLISKIPAERFLYLAMSTNLRKKTFKLKYNRSKTGDNGNAMFQSYLSKIFKKETG